MRQEEDFIKREIQKLTILLTKLIDSASNQNFEGIDTIDNILQSRFDFSIQDIITMDTFELRQKLATLHSSHIEKLAELIYELIKKDNFQHKKELVNKALLMLDFIDQKSNTFSISRQQLKMELLNHCSD